MPTIAKRVAAVLLGLTIGGLVVGVAVSFASIPAPPDPARFLGLANVWASRPAPGRACPGAFGELLVTSDDGHVQREPVVVEDVGRKGHGVVASYSGSWAVTRIVMFFIRDTHVYVQAGTHTDCGDFAGAVDAQSSEVHLHGDKLCFDLCVDLLDGGPTRERWAGQISLE